MWKVPLPRCDGTGVGCGTGGTCGTITASSQGEPKVTARVDDTKRPALAEIMKSQETLRKDRARAKA